MFFAFWSLADALVAAMRTGRYSIGVEIEPDYCRMAARYMKTENTNLFSITKLLFERAIPEGVVHLKEDQELYHIRPAKKRLE